MAIYEGDYKMLKPQYITGMAKAALYVRIVIHVFLRYTLELFKGKITPVGYVRLFYRLILLLKVVTRNKVVKIGDLYKLQLYFPAYPSASFFESLNKFVRPDPGPLTVVFSMTKACGYKCPHCYQRHDSGKDLEIGMLKKVAQDMQDVGVTMFDIEGGEPLLRYERLMELLSAFDGRRELWVNTTGHTLTLERAQAMKEAGVFGVMISLHTPDALEYEEFTGFEGSFAIAEEAARLFNQVGITVAINHCPSEELLDSGGIDEIMKTADKWNASFVQVIHGKSAGAWLGKENQIEEKNKFAALHQLHLKYNSQNEFASYPAASVQVYEEAAEHFGCTAGGIDRFYLNANGEVQPCEFLNISFGNVHDDNFQLIFGRMRSYFRKPGINWLCCSEAESIHKYMQEHDIETTPLPWEHTKELMKTWNKGPETPLYKDMGLYK
jgi:MoaA/NifB/PqqE/SkfB family radical SAM enzyme